MDEITFATAAQQMCMFMLAGMFALFLTLIVSDKIDACSARATSDLGRIAPWIFGGLFIVVVLVVLQRIAYAIVQ